MSLILFGDTGFFFCGCLANCNFSDEISVFYNGAWFVDCSRYKAGLLCIGGSEYNWQLSEVNPPSFPVNFRLGSHEPGVTEDGFVFS